MIIPLLIQRAFESGRLIPTKTESGYALAINYFGLRFVLLEITEAEFAELQKPNLVPVA